MGDHAAVDAEMVVPLRAAEIGGGAVGVADIMIDSRGIYEHPLEGLRDLRSMPFLERVLLGSLINYFV